MVDGCIFREETGKSAWLRVGGGWDGDVEEDRENFAYP